MAVNIPVRHTTTVLSKLPNGTCKQYVVNLHDTLWISAAQPLDLFGEGFEISYQGNENKPFHEVLASTLKLFVSINNQEIENTIGLITDFQEERFFISVTYDDGESVQTIWRGLILQDSVRIGDRRGCWPNEVELTAVDCITRLKELTEFLPFTTSAVPYNHVAVIMELLRRATPAPLYQENETILSTSVIWFEEQMPALLDGVKPDPLQLSYTTERAFLWTGEVDEKEKVNLYKILQQVLRTWGARIMHVNGQFFIIQVRALGDSITVTQYNKQYGLTYPPTMAPLITNGVNGVNITLPLLTTIDNPLTNNERDYYPSLGGVRIGYPVRVPTILSRLDLAPSTTAVGDFSLLQGYGAEFSLFCSYSYPVASITTITTTFTITMRAFDNSSSFYASSAGGSYSWQASPTTFDVTIQRITDGNGNQTYIYQDILPPLQGTYSIEFSYTVVHNLFAGGTITPSNDVISFVRVRPNPNDEDVNFQYGTTDSDSSKIEEINDLLINPVDIVHYPETTFYNGTNRVRGDKFGTNNPPVSGELYPLFLAKRYVSIQKTPRVKYYGQFWDELNAFDKISYDSALHLLMKGTFSAASGVWNVTLFEILSAAANIVDQGTDGPPPVLPTFNMAGLPDNPEQYDQTPIITPNRAGLGLITPVKIGGEWTDTETPYPPNTIFQGDGWLTVSNTETSEYPFPIASGPSQWLIEDTNFVTDSNTSVVYSGHTYTFTEPFFYNGLRVWVPVLTATTNYRVIIVDSTDPANPIYTAIEEPVLNANSWTIIGASKGILAAGTVLTVFIDALDTSTSTPFGPFEWIYEGPFQTAPPASGSWNRDNQHTILRINKLDNLGVDRTAELSGMITGTFLRTADQSNTAAYWDYNILTNPVDLGTYFEWSISLISTSEQGVPIGVISALSWSVPVPDPTEYVRINNYWISNPPPAGVSVEGKLEFDGVPQPLEQNTAFGVDLNITPVSFSEHFDIWAYSEELDRASTGGPQVEQINTLLQRWYFDAQTLPTVISSTGWLNIATFNSPLLTAGKFILAFSIRCSADLISRSFELQVLVDGAPVSLFIDEMKDSGNIRAYTEPAYLLDFNSSAPHTVELQARVEAPLNLTIIAFRGYLTFFE